jgi:hypothetical protein
MVKPYWEKPATFVRQRENAALVELLTPVRYVYFQSRANCYHNVSKGKVMTLTISIPPESEETLRHRAIASGQELSAYISQLVTHFSEPTTPLEELSGPIYQRFLESGMTDDELAEELERAKHEMRAERRARNAP